MLGICCMLCGGVWRRLFVYLTYPVSSLLGSIIYVNPDGISCPSSGHSQSYA